MSEFAAFDLNDILGSEPGDPLDPANQGGPKAVITQIHANGLVDLDFGAGRVAKNAEVGAWYSPRTGDVVRVVRADKGTLFALGPSRTSNQTTVEVERSIGIAYNVHPTLVPSLPNPLTVQATSTKSWRGSWERDEVYQGAYTPRYGYWRGLYFYGSAPQQLNGRRVTRIRIRISRKNEGGVISNVPQLLAGHIHEGIPGSAPVFTTGVHNAGVATRNAPVYLDLPVDWGQALIEGRLKGFGHVQDSTTHYSIAKSKAEDAATGELLIDWG